MLEWVLDALLLSLVYWCWWCLLEEADVEADVEGEAEEYVKDVEDDAAGEDADAEEEGEEGQSPSSPSNPGIEDEDEDGLGADDTSSW